MAAPFKGPTQRHSIRGVLFAAFATMGLITGALGGYGLHVLKASGKIVADTYDKPLMAINFAREASLNFAQMENLELRRKVAPASSHDEIDESLRDHTKTLFDDLAVVEERTTADDEHKVIGEIRQLVTE